jgi:hypothetical protein
MFRSFIIAIFIITASALCAVADFYPTTMLAEVFGSSSNPACLDAYAGIDTLHSNYHNGEFISARYYSQSDDLSNIDSEARVEYYNVNLFPTVIFNGIQTVLGNGVGVSDGSVYTNILQPRLFTASPLKIAITGFNGSSGIINARVTMMSPTYALVNQSFRFLLLENNVYATATHVVREVITQPITLSGAGNYLDFTATFTSVPPGSRPEYWAAAIVQLDNRSIIQTASTLAQPEYQIRAAMSFSPAIIAPANYNYTSQPIYFFNTGLADNYTIRLIKDDGPEDWYFNYCSENGECYPGSVPNPFTLAAGDTIGFHLNLLIGSSGIGNFHFEVESPNIAPYMVPFTYQTGTSNEDPYLPTADIRMLQNFPNPFSGSTTLRVSAKQAAMAVDITIYNSRGQKVKTFNLNKLNKGMNELVWSGTDNNGKQLPQGIYFSQINGIGDTQIRKMLLLSE